MRTSALSQAVYVCSTEVQCSFTHASRLQRQLGVVGVGAGHSKAPVLDVRRSTAPFRAPVNERNRFGEKYHASRFSNASHVASLVATAFGSPSPFRNFKPDSNRTANDRVANFRTIPAPRIFDIFANKSKQIPQKESARDKNLQTRPSTLDIPHASGDAAISGLRQRLPVFYSRSVGLTFFALARRSKRARCTNFGDILRRKGSRPTESRCASGFKNNGL
jgi:hypothetical protein